MGRRGRIIGGLAVLGLVGAGVVAVKLGFGPLPDPEGCTAQVGGRMVELDTAR